MFAGTHSMDVPARADWVDFANAQRAHQNFVEGIATIVVFICVVSIWYPLAAAGAGALYIVGREIYSFGYRAYGPAGRLAGAITLEISVVGCFFAGIYLSLAHTGILDKFFA